MSIPPKKKMGRGSKIALAITAIAGAGIGYYLYSKSGGLSSITGQTVPDYGVAGPTYTQVTPTSTDGTTTPISTTPFDWGSFLKSFGAQQQNVPSLSGGYSGGGDGTSGGLDLSWLKDLLSNLNPKVNSPTVTNPPSPVPTPVPQAQTVPTNTPSQDIAVTPWLTTRPATALDVVTTGIFRATVPVGTAQPSNPLYQAGLMIGEISAMGPFGVPYYIGQQVLGPSLTKAISSFFSLPTVSAQQTPTRAPTQVPIQSAPPIYYTPPVKIISPGAKLM